MEIYESIIENGVEVYKNHFCQCLCGRKILYPSNKKTLNEHKRRGIPKFISGHNRPMYGKHPSKETREKMSIAKRGKRPSNYGKHPSKEAREKMSKSHIGKTPSKETREKMSKSRSGENHPMWNKHPSKETREKMSKNHRDMHGKNNPNYGENKYYKNHPDIMIKHMKKMHGLSKQISKQELKVREELDNLNIKYTTNVHEIIGTPDIVITNKDTNPIALFVDGCYWHGCLKCFPFGLLTSKDWERQRKRRDYDDKINNKLIKLGYIVIRIYEHSINNKEYKQIIMENIK